MVIINCTIYTWKRNGFCQFGASADSVFKRSPTLAAAHHPLGGVPSSLSWAPMTKGIRPYALCHQAYMRLSKSV
jgi:hypothetical protein